MKYIESFREGERISGIYLCKNRQSAVTKTGKAYENVVLQDKNVRLMPKSGIPILRELMIFPIWIM